MAHDVFEQRFVQLMAILVDARTLLDASFLPSAPDDAPETLAIVVENGHLGIPVGLLLPLADVARARFHESRAAGAVDLAATSGLLLVNGWHAEAWHARKRWIAGGSGDADLLATELALTALVLHAHPKAEPAWAHRRWCLRRLTTPVPAAMLEIERQLCTRLAELHSSNYHAWSHRGWLAALVAPVDQAHLQADALDTGVWVQAHRADHCGWHHRVLLLHLLTSALCPHHARALEGHPPPLPPPKPAPLGSDMSDACAVCALWHRAVAEGIAALVETPELEAPWAHVTTLLTLVSRLACVHDAPSPHDETAIYKATLQAHFGSSHPLPLGQLLLALNLHPPLDAGQLGERRRLLAHAPPRFAALAADLSAG